MPRYQGEGPSGPRWFGLRFPENVHLFEFLVDWKLGFCPILFKDSGDRWQVADPLNAARQSFLDTEF